LVGRATEVAALDGHVRAALDGAPQLVFLEGDPGIGKSRLAREVERRASAHGAAVCVGHCRERLELPYLPFVTSLLPRLESLARDDPELASSHPVLARLLGLPAAAPGGQAEVLSAGQEQPWLFLTVARTTMRLARAQPLVLVIEDLHWVDRPSLDLLVHLAMEAGLAALTGPVPLLVVVTHRSDLPHEVDVEVARLRREQYCSRITLRPLSDLESGELVRALGIDRAPQQVTDVVHAKTGGNPLLIETTCRELADTRHPSAADVELAVPADLSDALARRIAEASPRCRDTLTAIALMGSAVAPDDLVAVTGTAREDLGPLLAEGERLGLLHRTAATVAIANPLYGRMLAATPALSARQALHLGIADALARHDETDGRRSIETAAHLIAAGDLVAPSRLLPTCREAADRAFGVLAWAEAARDYDAALAAAEQLGEAPAVLAELYLAGGIAHARNLDPEPAASRLNAAASAYREIRDVRGLATALAERTKLDIGAAAFGVTIELDRLEAALDGVRPVDASLAARLLVHLADALWVAGHAEQGQQAATRALQDARDADDPGSCARALTTLAMIAWLRLDLHRARECLEEARSLAGTVGEAYLEAAPLARLALTLAWLGDDAAAVEAAHVALDLTARTGDHAQRSLALTALVVVATARGDLEGAVAHGEEAWLAARRSRYEYACHLFLPAMACTHLLRGDPEAADAVLRRILELEPAGGEAALSEHATWLARQVVRAHGGEHDEVTRELALHPERLRARWPTVLGTVGWFVELAELADVAAADVDLKRVARGLARAADRGMLLTDGLSALVPRVQGTVARLRGDLDGAERHLIEAEHLAGERRWAPEEARARLEHARVLLARGGDDNRAAARALAQAAAVSFAELGASTFSVAARAVVAACTPAAASAPGLADPQDTDRETTAVILFVDVVSSTALTEELGDLAYRARASTLEAGLRQAILHCRGRAVEGVTLGDGVLAMFPSARRAIVCADRAHAAATTAGLSIRVGIHAGDVIRSAGSAHGGAVNLAARICEQAEPGETLVSDIVRSLARTSVRATFTDRGAHELKGLVGEHHLSAVTTDVVPSTS